MSYILVILAHTARVLLRLASIICDYMPVFVCVHCLHSCLHIHSLGLHQFMSMSTAFTLHDTIFMG